MMSLSKKPGICDCPGCGKEFKRTGNCQKKCPEHQGKPLPKSAQGPTGAATRKNAAPLIIKKTPVEVILADEIESELVIKILIAGGFVTEEKVQAARRLVAGL